MQNQQLTLEPQRYEWGSPYLSIDLSRVRESVERLISESGQYFSKPLDDALFEVTSVEGVHRQQVNPHEALKVFEIITNATAQMKLTLSVEERTPHRGWKMPPRELVNFNVYFFRRTIFSNISILGFDKAQQIGKILTEGIVLV